MSCSCDRWYDAFAEEFRKAEVLEEEVERLRIELATMTALRDSWKRSAKEIAAQRDTWKQGCDDWTQIAREALDATYRVRKYAESRCTEEYQDYASASVVLAYLDGEIEEADE